MKKRIIWIAVSCLIITTLVMASCTPAVTEEKPLEPPEVEKELEKETEDAEFFRVIGIPKRSDSYYNDFESMVISTQIELDSFLNREYVARQMRDYTGIGMVWGVNDAFEDAINNADVDFTKEALVLLQNTQGSGSVKVTFETPVFSEGKLLCKIAVHVPEGVHTMDMAYYCFAVVVCKDIVKEIELTVDHVGKLQLLVSDTPSPTTEQPSQSTTPEPTPMLAQMETIVKSDVCGIGTKKQVVIDTQAAWEELWVAAGFDRMLLEPSPPIVDFSQETVIAVFSGSHGSTGYHIEITEIRITEDEVTIVFKERSPELGSAVGWGETQPYHIVKTKSFWGGVL